MRHPETLNFDLCPQRHAPTEDVEAGAVRRTGLPDKRFTSVLRQVEGWRGGGG